jgi:hypothetical protein
MGLYWPKPEKRIPSNLEGHYATLGANVPAFISNLGPITNPKMLKVHPKFFWALTPSVKRALPGTPRLFQWARETLVFITRVGQIQTGKNKEMRNLL